MTDTSMKPSVTIPEGEPSFELELEDIVVGEGEEATAGRIAEVHYVGVAWSTGSQFDASWDRGQTFKFALGKCQVIAGWDEGVTGMRVGSAPDHHPAAPGLRQARRGQRDRARRDAGLRGRPARAALIHPSAGAGALPRPGA
ncbi:MAG: FKBP-type peptidyl-prolyl cis-trans isomerase [Miltoncostaeaceae bacterium]